MFGGPYMSYTISLVKDENIVCIKGYGRLTAEEYMKGSREVIDLVVRYGSTRLFVDDRLVDNAASVFDLYKLPEFFYEIGLPTSVKIALLVDAASADKVDFRFFETVCRNSGYVATIFYSYDKAMEWLKSK
jgi:hypothetical protein